MYYGIILNVLAWGGREGEREGEEGRREGRGREKRGTEEGKKRKT